MNITDNILFKYGSVLVGYSVLGVPVFSNSKTIMSSNTSLGNIAGSYIKNSSLLINLAKGIGKFIISYKSLQNLAG